MSPDDSAAPGHASDETDVSSSVTDDRTSEHPTTAEDLSQYTTDVRTVSPRVHVHWAIRLLVGLAVLAAVGRWVTPRVGFGQDLVLPAVGVLAVLGLIWVHLRYRVWCYHLRDDALYLERGVVTHVRTVAPHVRVQHVDTSRSPLERALGLSTLVVYTAGSRGADVSIPGLTPSEATDLQRRLKELAIETEGGDAL